MTDQTNEPLDPKSASNESSSTSAEESGTAAAEENQTDILADDGLPEWEPLTPELVEDEAIRGDFVLRWVVVGLALLLGISQISETRTLVHIKHGQYLLSHGIIPSSNDVLSYTANDRPWVNLSWLFDIASAGVYALGGGIGLSLVQGLLAALTFGLISHTVRPNIRTWWGSLCAVLALLVSYLQFTIQPELITLLGMSFLLWTLVWSEEEGHTQRVWLAVPALWLWAQFDQRAWIGWLLLFLWFVGERLSSQKSTLRGKSHLGNVVLASLAIMAVHPFLWKTWLAPLQMYLTDYPAMRFAYQGSSLIDPGYFPIWKPILWSPLNHRTIAALVLFAATAVTMFLNRSRVLWSHLYAFIGLNSLSLFATHELAAASLMNCVLCTINAQTWYREKFGQVYSVDWRELLFSRGGRAITVLSFFTLSWLILSGRLDGPAGKRTGIGFDSHLATAMNEYRNMNVDLIDDQPFNFSMRQGDLMIWAGLKPFVDSRAGLYYGTGNENLLDTHNKTRRALRRKRDQVEGSGEPTVWKETFDRFHIRQAWPRLNGPVPPPDYPSFLDMLSSEDFAINKLNAVTAVFLRKDLAEEKTAAFLAEHQFDFVEQAFRAKSEKTTDLTREWSKPATTYDNLFSLRRPIVPGGVQAAQHYLELASVRGGLPNSQITACAYLAIRHANEGLHVEPNSAAGYQVLGRTYSILGQLESFILNKGERANLPNRLRYLQAVSALQQAVSLQPDDIGSILKLIEQYQLAGQIDIQLDLFQKLKNVRQYSAAMTPEELQDRNMIISEIDRLTTGITEIDTRINSALNEGAERLQIAMGAYQLGALLKAIQTLEEDAIYLEKNPQSKLMLGNWMIEAGRGRDAASIFESLEGLATDNSFAGWRDSAAISALTVANYVRSTTLWSDQLRETTTAQIPQALYTLPFMTLNPLWSQDSYPLTHIGATVQIVQGIRFDGATLAYHMALAQLESGANEGAANSIRQSLQLNPNSPLRPILRFYLECLTGEQVVETPPEQTIEELFDLADVVQPEPDSK